MPMEYAATLRLKADDQTASAFQSAATASRQMGEQQARASRTMRADIDHVGRSYRALRRTALIGGAAKIFAGAVTQAASFGDKLNRIRIAAGASEPTMARVASGLRKHAETLRLDVDKVADGYEAWRIASRETAEEALASFAGIAQLASAVGDEGVAPTAKLVGTLKNTLKLSAPDMALTMDMLAKSSVGIGMPFETFAEQFGGMSEEMKILGLGGAKGAQQMLGLFNAIQAKTGDAEQSFKMMQAAMKAATDPGFLEERWGKGVIRGTLQEVVKAGGNVVDKLVLMALQSGYTGNQMREHFGPELAELIEGIHDRQINVKDATEAIAKSAGTMGDLLKQNLESPMDPIKALKQEFANLLAAIGELALGINNLFGDKNFSLIGRTASMTKVLTEVLRGDYKAATKAAMQAFPEAAKGGATVREKLGLPALPGGGGEEAPGAPAAGGAAAQVPAQPGEGPAAEAAGEGRVEETQQRVAGIRRLPISPQLRQQLESAAQQSGLKVRVFSGGQARIGTGGPRTGSTRHDVGGAADVQLYDPKTGGKLDMRKPEDAARMALFTEKAVAAGATGVGAGLGYMGPSSIHIGGGKAAHWGGAEWIKGARERGEAARTRTRGKSETIASAEGETKANGEAEPGAEKGQTETNPNPGEAKEAMMRMRFEHQPGELQAFRRAIRREVRRESREAKWNSYLDTGAA